jgi:hypothetical protein
MRLMLMTAAVLPIDAVLFGPMTLGGIHLVEDLDAGLGCLAGNELQIGIQEKAGDLLHRTEYCAGMVTVTVTTS